MYQCNGGAAADDIGDYLWVSPLTIPDDLQADIAAGGQQMTVAISVLAVNGPSERADWVGFRCLDADGNQLLYEYVTDGLTVDAEWHRYSALFDIPAATRQMAISAQWSDGYGAYRQVTLPMITNGDELGDPAGYGDGATEGWIFTGKHGDSPSCKSPLTMTNELLSQLALEGLSRVQAIVQLGDASFELVGMDRQSGEATLEGDGQANSATVTILNICGLDLTFKWPEADPPNPAYGLVVSQAIVFGDMSTPGTDDAVSTIAKRMSRGRLPQAGRRIPVRHGELVELAALDAKGTKTVAERIEARRVKPAADGTVYLAPGQMVDVRDIDLGPAGEQLLADLGVKAVAAPEDKAKAKAKAKRRRSGR